MRGSCRPTQADRAVHDRHPHYRREPELYLDRLKARFPEVSFHTAAEPDDLARILKEHPPRAAFAIGDNGFTKSGQRIAYEHEGLEFFQVGGSGYDQLLPLDRPTVTVANCAGVLARFLAETVTGAMLAINGNFFPYARHQQSGQWNNIPFRPLTDQTLLVVGLGSIGGWVAHNAKALGMRVLATRRTPGPHDACDEVHASNALPDLLPQADFVSLHVRLNDETQHMINADSLALMKPGSVLMNTARGGCVDTAALIAALESGHLRAAYLDVFEEEPLPTESPVWTAPNLFATPHCADMIDGWQVRFSEVFADNLERLLTGQPLTRVVS